MSGIGRPARGQREESAWDDLRRAQGPGRATQERRRCGLPELHPSRPLRPPETREGRNQHEWTDAYLADGADSAAGVQGDAERG